MDFSWISHDPTLTQAGAIKGLLCPNGQITGGSEELFKNLKLILSETGSSDSTDETVIFGSTAPLRQLRGERVYTENAGDLLVCWNVF